MELRGDGHGLPNRHVYPRLAVVTGGPRLQVRERLGPALEPLEIGADQRRAEAQSAPSDAQTRMLHDHHEEARLAPTTVRPGKAVIEDSLCSCPFADLSALNSRRNAPQLQVPLVAGPRNQLFNCRLTNG
jgi:hypothetical protein